MIKTYSFSEFLKAVDNDTWVSMGMSVHDLPDFNYRDYWDTDIVSQGEFDNAVQMCVHDVIAENGMDRDVAWL
jgi:hypothetical protein